MANRANYLNGSEWLRNSFSIWRNLGRDPEAKDHPAPFPIALASRLIDCYVSDRNGVVLDPFAGSGSTLLAGLNAGMDVVGFDVNPNYRELFKKRLLPLERISGRWKYEILDARSLEQTVEPESIQICITSPPYWDILNRRRSADQKLARPYSNDVNDIGNVRSYEVFLDALAMVANQVGIALQDRSYFILNVMDIRKGGNFYPLHLDAIRAIQKETELALEDIIIWDRQPDYNRMRPLGYPRKFIINKVHEYLLVFRRAR